MPYDYIRKSIGEAACYEQLAEEAAELGHAALKVARKLRGENPTPVELEEALKCVNEEYSDVILTSGVLEMKPDTDICVEKAMRWINRIDRKRVQGELDEMNLDPSTIEVLSKIFQ